MMPTPNPTMPPVMPPVPPPTEMPVFVEDTTVIATSETVTESQTVPVTAVPMVPATPVPVPLVPVAEPVTPAVTPVPVTPAVTPVPVVPVSDPVTPAVPAANANGAGATVVAVNGVPAPTPATFTGGNALPVNDEDCFEQLSTGLLGGKGKGKGGKAGIRRDRRTRERRTRTRGRRLQTDCAESKSSSKDDLGVLASRSESLNAIEESPENSSAWTKASVSTILSMLAAAAGFACYLAM